MKRSEEKKRGRWIRAVLLAAGCLLLLIVGYLLYVIFSYHRISDRTELEVHRPAENGETAGTDTADGCAETGKEYTIVSWNAGFGAYTPSFSFFMDGGRSSVAESRESVEACILGGAELIAEEKPEFAIVQEVDLDSTRSHHVDEYALLTGRFGEAYSTFAVNYDSAFLMFPPWEPHGKSLSGIAFYSDFPITQGERRSLPVSESFGKYVDLDRCYSVNRIPVNNGKELVILAVHMSAYGNSDEIRQGQVSMLAEEMRQEYEKGNYVICGGDFNHDLKADEEETGERASWAYPFPRTMLPEGFSFAIDEADDGMEQHDSSRNADMPYVEGKTYTVTLDGFIFSDNMELKGYEVKNTGFRFSDHEPVMMRFILKGE